MSSEYKKTVKTTNYTSQRIASQDEAQEFINSSDRRYLLPLFRDNSRNYLPSANVKMASSKYVQEQGEGQSGSRYTISQQRSYLSPNQAEKSIPVAGPSNGKRTNEQ